MLADNITHARSFRAGSKCNTTQVAQLPSEPEIESRQMRRARERAQAKAVRSAEKAKARSLRKAQS